ncbi:MAG: DUF3568 family protein [Candidatus Omnitrophota bacterium]
MFKKVPAYLIALMLGVSIVTFSGCTLLFGAAAGGAGTAFWLSGKLREELAASYQQTISAAENALDSLDMEITKKTHSENVTQFKSIYSDGSTVWIDIRPILENKTEIEVRVGMRGNQSASAEILERIKDYL